MDDQLERIGQLIDKADNYLEFAKDSPPSVFPPSVRLDAMGVGLAKIRQELFEIYTSLGGEDVWTMGE